MARGLFPAVTQTHCAQLFRKRETRSAAAHDPDLGATFPQALTLRNVASFTKDGLFVGQTLASEIAAMATELAELLGASLGLKLLCGIPLLASVLLVGIATCGAAPAALGFPVSRNLDRLLCRRDIRQLFDPKSGCCGRLTSRRVIAVQPWVGVSGRK